MQIGPVYDTHTKHFQVLSRKYHNALFGANSTETIGDLREMISTADFEPLTRKRAYTLRQASDAAGLSVPYLRLQINAGLLKATRFGRAVRVLDEDLMEFLRAGVPARQSVYETRQPA